MTNKTTVPNWLMPALFTAILAVNSWTLKSIIELKTAVAVQANIQAAAHDAQGSQNGVLASHSKMLGNHDNRITRLETLIAIEPIRK